MKGIKQMDNRRIFRAYLTCDFYDDNGNSETVYIPFYTETVYDDCVGIDLSDLEDQILKAKNVTNEQKNQILSNIELQTNVERIDEFDWCYVDSGYDFCTGRKDINGKLIFERDLIEFTLNKNTTQTTVVYNEQFSCFCTGVRVSEKGRKTYPLLIPKRCKIVG